MSAHIKNDRGDYVAWLVEKRDDQTYLALNDVLDVVWVTDADDAVHFARRADAERMIIHADLLDLSVADHMWLGGVPRDPVIPYWSGKEGEGS